MDRKALIADLLRDLSTLAEKVPGIYLYGSQAEGTADERSDVDICLVAGSSLDPVHLQSLAWRERRSERYDIRIFELLPLYIQVRILSRGILVSSPDPAGLAEYLYPYWKRWDDQRWYQSPVPGAP
ncbi:MAG: nucleotidyltransferase domain-containing protein [Methanospirillum sp.]|uniref:nucleotidyltransferase domain-containing protein n=1 Tax=Methanospirillum sp. TaxID=45200 RepID=UPI0023694F1A|nr:nucleotidyltransferase domain-containing protein [Methanospirillum sp.]MDD1729506.1 nucleotidyltransferase domain-containing protein [Methanospirillum sp.]